MFVSNIIKTFKNCNTIKLLTQSNKLHCKLHSCADLHCWGKSKCGFMLLGSRITKSLNLNRECSRFAIKLDPNEEKNPLDLKEFNSYFKTICDDLTYTDNPVLKEATNWCLKVCQYNLNNGKKNRGLILARAYKIFSTSGTSHLSAKHAIILGWCVELLQAYFLICDDIMDQSTMRRGEICWYLQPDVGFCAINDALLLQSGIYKILRKYFQNYNFYENLLHEFLEITEKTVYGQSLDILSCPHNKGPEFENFTYEKYQAIVEHKTSYYTYCLPVHLAMHVDGRFTAEDFAAAKLLCLKLGLLFQIQDDFLDCYGNSDVTGKIGNDISQGKCSWFAVSLFELGSDAMKQSMMKNYGVSNSECVSKVLKMYDELDLKEKYYAYENKLYLEISSLINQVLSNNLLRSLFHVLLEKTYQRKK